MSKIWTHNFASKLVFPLNEWHFYPVIKPETWYSSINSVITKQKSCLIWQVKRLIIYLRIISWKAVIRYIIRPQRNLSQTLYLPSNALSPKLTWTVFSRILTTADPWTWVWTEWVHLHKFFSINTISPSYPRVSHPHIQPTTDWKQYFTFPVVDSQAQSPNCRSKLNQQMWRTNCRVKSYT